MFTVAEKKRAISLFERKVSQICLGLNKNLDSLFVFNYSLTQNINHFNSTSNLPLLNTLIRCFPTGNTLSAFSTINAGDQM